MALAVTVSTTSEDHYVSASFGVSMDWDDRPGLDGVQQTPELIFLGISQIIVHPHMNRGFKPKREDCQVVLFL